MIRPALLVTFAIAICALSAGIAAGKPLSAAPNWELKDLDGKAVRLSDFKGKVVILNFWATWCPPCREEIPGFIELQKKYGSRGLVVIGVSMDEDSAPVKSFVRKQGMNYHVVLGDMKVAAAYGGLEIIPSTVVINKDGKIIAAHVGYEEQATFESEIKPLL